jgi:hypothetical protein
VSIVNDSFKPSNSSFFVPAENIVAIKRDLDSLVHAFEEMRNRIEERRADFDAAMRFKPPGFDLDEALATIAPPALTEPPEPEEEEEEDDDEGDDKITWVGEVRRILTESGKGWTYRDLLAELKKGPLGERSTPKEKGFYTAIAKVQDREEAMKSGNMLYSMALYKELKAAGVPLPKAQSNREGRGVIVIRELLTKHSKGLTAILLKQLMRGEEDIPRSFFDHSQYIYNVLKRLVEDGEIKKRNGVYVLVK